jgi:hypothetical protein
MAVDKGGSVYMTGSFSGFVNFDPGEWEYVLSTSPSATGTGRTLSVFVSKLDTDGNFVTAANVESAGYVSNGAGIAVDGSGNVYTTGGFRGTADFDPTAGTYNLTAQGFDPSNAVATARLDVFVAKWTQSDARPTAGPARTAAGQGKDAAQRAGAERSQLLREALDWLTGDLAAWAKLADRPDARALLRQTLEQWQKDPDLACVREEPALAKLPEAEREAWRKLWANVAETLARTDAPKAPDSPRPKP